jgi:acyl carrier protein
LNRPELTAEKFIPHPFSVCGARIYRTGDLGRYLPDGNIEFLGRIDHQVKVRGYRIELGEIEAVLKQHEGVLDAAVVVRKDANGITNLVGYVVFEEGKPNLEELRNFLKTKLPGYMIPTALVNRPSLPITASGKVDRRSLAALEPALLDRDREFVAPATLTEQLVAKIWSDVLGVERVSTNDNFFALGGHSLLSIKVISDIRKHFELELPIRTLFETSDLATLAHAIEVLQQESRSLQDSVPEFTV